MLNAKAKALNVIKTGVKKVDKFLFEPTRRVNQIQKANDTKAREMDLKEKTGQL